MASRERHEIIYNLFITLVFVIVILLIINYLIKYEKFNLYLKSGHSSSLF